MNAAKQRFVCGLLAVVLALPTAAETVDGAESEASRPNILLITIDTQRADSFGIYGNEGNHTPNIDRLAAGGVVFERATAPVGTTFPSHATLLTGLYPRAHGVRYNGDALEEEIVTLAERLLPAGYETMAFVTYGSMVSRGGLGQGFIRTSHEKDGPAAHSTSPKRITSMARGLLKRKRPSPFFMWVHYYHPHSPYDLTPYSKEKLEGYEGAFADGATVKEFYTLQNKGKLTDDDRKALRTLYDGETREADRTVGSILEALEEAGHAKNTIVVVTSDHGELLGEHDDVGHGPRLWDPVLRVPLVIYDPRAPQPRRVASRVGLVDVSPTLLEMVGLEVPAGIDGRSLAPALRGDDLDDRPYYSEVSAVSPSHKARKPGEKKGQGPDQTRAQKKDQKPGQKKALKKGQKKAAKVPRKEPRTHEWDETAVAVLLGDQKLIVQNGQARRYDLAKDPAELTPIPDTADDPSAAELMKLAQEYGKRKQRTGGQVDPKDLSPKVEAELRSLGYLQ